MGAQAKKLKYINEQIKLRLQLNNNH